MATVKDQVTEVLLGTSDEPDLSHEMRQNFLDHATKDEASGELFMGKEQFINAVAPEKEDYVSAIQLCGC